MITCYHSYVTQNESGELSTLMEQRAYNLRSRKDDSVTLQRRSEFARQREQQRTQRRIEREKAEEEKIREYMKKASKRMKEMIDRLPKRSEVDMENRSEHSALHIHRVLFLS